MAGTLVLTRDGFLKSLIQAVSDGLDRGLLSPSEAQAIVQSIPDPGRGPTEVQAHEDCLPCRGNNG